MKPASAIRGQRGRRMDREGLSGTRVDRSREDLSLKLEALVRGHKTPEAVLGGLQELVLRGDVRPEDLPIVERMLSRSDARPLHVAAHTDSPGGARHALVPEIRRLLEAVAGRDLSAVTVRDGADAGRIARGLGANAMVRDGEILVANSSTAKNPALMAHEVTHLLQRESAGVGHSHTAMLSESQSARSVQDSAGNRRNLDAAMESANHDLEQAGIGFLRIFDAFQGRLDQIESTNPLASVGQEANGAQLRAFLGRVAVSLQADALTEVYQQAVDRGLERSEGREGTQEGIEEIVEATNVVLACSNALDMLVVAYHCDLARLRVAEVLARQQQGLEKLNSLVGEAGSLESNTLKKGLMSAGTMVAGSVLTGGTLALLQVGKTAATLIKLAMSTLDVANTAGFAEETLDLVGQTQQKIEDAAFAQDAIARDLQTRVATLARIAQELQRLKSLSEPVLADLKRATTKRVEQVFGPSGGTGSSLSGSPSAEQSAIK